MRMAVYSAAVLAFLSVFSVEAFSTQADSGTTIQSIASLEDVDQIVRDTQWQFWRVVPPATENPFYLHPEQFVRIVDWDSKDWPKPFLKQMYAEMGAVGTSMYPLYMLTVVEERSGDLVYYNSYGQEAWRTSAPVDYNPYLFAFLQYGVETVEELSDMQRIFGRSSNVGTEIVMLPLDFAQSYLTDAALDAGALPLAPGTFVSEEPLMTTLSDPPPPEGGGGTNTNSTVNIPATLTFAVPSDFGSSTGEIFQCTNLVAVVSWSVLVESYAVTAGVTQVWTDVTSSNIPVRFYILNDPSRDFDYDGLNDGREYYVYLTDYALYDSDGDLMADGWELLHGFDPLDDSDGQGDADSDDLTNAEEYERGTNPNATNLTGVLITIPGDGNYRVDEPYLELNSL